METIYEKFEIDGRSYTTTRLPIFQAVRIHSAVKSAIGAGLKDALSSIDSKSGAKEIVGQLVAMLGMIEMEKIIEIAPQVLASVNAQPGKLGPGIAEPYFQNYPQDFYPVLLWALAVNISPFFEGAAGGWKALGRHLGLSSQTTFGSSGGSPVR